MGWQDNVWIGLSADHISPVLWERIYSPDGANAVGSSAEGGQRLVEVTALGQRRLRQELGLTFGNHGCEPFAARLHGRCILRKA